MNVILNLIVAIILFAVAAILYFVINKVITVKLKDKPKKSFYITYPIWLVMFSCFGAGTVYLIKSLTEALPNMTKYLEYYL